MEKRSAQKNQRRRRARERRMIAAALPVIALAVLAAALSSLWGGIHLREDAAPIPGGSEPALAVFRSDPAEYTEDQDP